MSLAALDRLAEAQRRLIAALDGGDAAAVDVATRSLAAEVEQVRAVAGWRATPELRQSLRDSLKTGEAARIRAGYLSDHGRKRLEAHSAIVGRAPLGYGRNGRACFPAG